MKNKKEIHGIIVIGISFMIVYFFTWKNFQEYREKNRKKEEMLQKIMLQEKHYQELQQQLKIMKISLPHKGIEEQNQEMFSHLLEFEILLQRVLEKHHLQLQGLGRIQKEGNRLFISSKIQGKIYNLLMLIQELEQDSRRVSFSEEYWKLERSHNQTAILDCNFVIYVKEGEYDFEVITRNNKKNRVPFVHLAKKTLY